MNSTDSISAKIVDFNYGFGVILSRESAYKPHLNAQIFESSKTLVLRELDELRKAISEKNAEELVDALGDILYLLYGMLIRQGLLISDVEPIGSIQTDLSTLYSLLEERTRALKFPPLITDLEIDKLRSELSDVIMIVIRSFSWLGCDYRKILNRIHESNMQKFASSEKHAQESIRQYDNYVTPTGERYLSVSYRPSPGGDRWVVFDVDQKKVLKAKGWQPPQLGDLLGNFDFSVFRS